MTTRAQILKLLADGELHSGADLGRRLGITRAAVSKAVKALCENGLVVDAVAGQGYRLEAPLTPLDRRRIASFLPKNIAPLPRIEILEEVDSTNRHLLALALAAADPSGMVTLCDVQPQGRGRRGRTWVASAYRNIMMSIAWRFAVGPAMVAGLSLAAGVAAMRALEAYGVRGAGLKWPNDVLWNERKLAGLLADVHGEASGPCTVVLGIGINCHIVPSDAKRIDQAWVDLFSITNQAPDRNRLVALLIQELYQMFHAFAQNGLPAFLADWNRYHIYAERTVKLTQGESSIEGTVEGIDPSGALRLRNERGQTQLFHSGDVSLRVR